MSAIPPTATAIRNESPKSRVEKRRLTQRPYPLGDGATHLTRDLRERAQPLLHRRGSPEEAGGRGAGLLGPEEKRGHAPAPPHGLGPGQRRLRRERLPPAPP